MRMYIYMYMYTYMYACPYTYTHIHIHVCTHAHTYNTYDVLLICSRHVRAQVQIHLCEPPGDILIFLTGEDEIEQACAKIEAVRMRKPSRCPLELLYFHASQLRDSYLTHHTHTRTRNLCAYANTNHRLTIARLPRRSSKDSRAPK